jgi:predicted regulator of Ras-like GTPase activity (Roadblock/LC7/MglB family)
MRKIKWLLLYGLLFTVQSLLAQSNINGKIIGEKDGAPIAGATIC